VAERRLRDLDEVLRALKAPEAEVIAACGGGGSSPSTTSSHTAAARAATPDPAATPGATGTSGATGDPGAFAARRTALAACLKKAGITLPNFGGGRRFRFGATGASGRPRFFGGTGASGASGRPRFFGGTGPSGARGPGFFGGGAGAFANNPKLAQAFAKCLASDGGFGGAGGRRPGAFVARTARQRAAITSYAACMRSHGVNLPTPNFSGHGSIFGNSVNRNTTTFRNANANAACVHLLTFLPRSVTSGATGSTGTA
jgi:hypothetical protein